MSRNQKKITALLIMELLCLPLLLFGQANMRREGSLTLIQTNTDTKGFYAATIDPANGFAYFGSKAVYKINLATSLPTQIGSGIFLGGNQCYSAAMDSTAGCAYFGAGTSIYQILANGTNSPGMSANPLYLGGGFITQILIDTTDPANHYLYAMTESSGSLSILYKIALNNFPNNSSIIGSASAVSPDPALGYGVIDLTNKCAYYGNFIANTSALYLVKFSLGAGASPPSYVGAIVLDAQTNRASGNIQLDLLNGYGYSDSDDTDSSFGHARVYKWALNGANVPTLVSYTDMHTNEGYCHVSVIEPARGLLYYSSDLSYPAYVYRFRLPPGTNAPVETGNIPLLNTTNINVPAWGTNPTNSSEWGEVFARSMVYDPVRDFAYIGRDCADAQVSPYTNQIVKVALDRDEALVALTEDTTNANNAIPYSESFESYTNGFSLVGTNGWYGEDTEMGIVVTNNYASSYAGDFPIPTSHQLVLQVDGAVTNRFSPSPDSNVWVDFIMEGEYWTDPILLTLSNTPFAMCVTTNGHLAVWNCTNPPAPGNGWTELWDTSVASNQFIRVTVEASYTRDSNGEYHYRIWENGTPSANPQTWYTAADTNNNYFGDFLAQGRFALDDLVVTEPDVAINTITRNQNNTVSLSCRGLPGLPHRVWATTNLRPPSWQSLSTNQAGADGSWQFTDTNTAGYPLRFYRASLP